MRGITILVAAAAFIPTAVASEPQAAAPGTEPLTRAEIVALTRLVGSKAGLHPDLFEALVWAESNFDVSAVSPVGAQGLAQLMPTTARELGIPEGRDFEPLLNLRGGASYLAAQIEAFGSIERGLAAYNAGPARAGRPFELWPRETRLYVAKVLRRAGFEAEDPSLAAAMSEQPPLNLAPSDADHWIGGIASMPKENVDDQSS